MGGVALNLAADREPVLWLPALMTALFAALAWFCRARPLALGLSLAIAALFAGFLSMSLRTARVAAPVLDRIRIVTLQGYVEEVDLRTVGARMVIGVVSADGMPQEKVPRRVRVTTRNTPDVAAGDYIEFKARLLPPSRAALPGGYDFARDAFFAGVGAVGSTLGPIQHLPPPGDASWRQRFDAAIDQARNRLALRVNAIIGGDEGAIAAAMVTGKRDFLSNDAKDLIREAGIFHIITISGVQMTLVAGIIFVVSRRLLALSPMLALNYPIKKWAAAVAMVGSVFYDLVTGSRVGTERALIMTLIVLSAVIMNRRALTMRNLAFAVLAVVAIEPEAILGVSFQLSFAAVAALVAVMDSRIAGMDVDPDPFLPKRGAAAEACVLRGASHPEAARPSRRHRFRDFGHRFVHGLSFPRSQPLRADRQSADADRHRGLRRAGRAAWRRALSARARRAGLDLCRRRHQVHPVGRAVHRAGASFDRAFAGVRALRAAVSGARRDERDDLADVDLPAQRHSVGAHRDRRRDAGAALRCHRCAIRRSGGGSRRRWRARGGRQALQRLRRRAMADGATATGAIPLRRAPSTRPATASAASPLCRKGESLSIVLDSLAFDEDCARAEVVVSALSAPAGCKAKFLFDEQALARLGAVGLTWGDKGFTLASDRTPLENRPWSPAPQPARDDRIVRPGHGGSHGADPADVDVAPEEGRTP